MFDSQQIQAAGQREQKQSLTKYNANIVRQYLRVSRYSIIFLLIIWITFIVECIKTWALPSKSNAPVSISTLILLEMGANVPTLVKSGQIYRLISATFLHAGILHIFMNSLSLLMFCAQIQAQVNFKRYLFVYLIGGIYGNLLSDFFNLNLGNNVVAVGASTSICAVMGLYIGNLYIESIKIGRVDVAKKQIASMLIYLLLISLLPGVDFFGHFGSLIGGILMTISFFDDSNGEFIQIKWACRILLTLYTLVLLMIFI